MTLETNEQEIYKKLNQNKFNLYTVLSSKVNSETNDYFYSGETNVSYMNYSPTLDTSLEVVKYFSNSNAFVDQGNGVVSLKGAVLKNGWQNTLWEMSVDIQFYSSIHKVYATSYIGFILLTDADNPFPYHDTNASHIGWGIVAWENGYIAGTPQLQDNSVGTYTKTPNSMLSISGNRWYTLHVKKISQTVLEVWLNDDIQNKVVYDWNELSDAANVTFGCTTNPSNPELDGSLLIRNLTVDYLDGDNIPYTMTKLCEDAKSVKSNTQNSAVLPSKPTIINSNRLGVREYNIHNKIQYCNNLLRYTLRKNGIEFNNSNKMHELIKFLDSIEYDFIQVEKALQNVSLDNNGNLVIEEYEGNVFNQTLVVGISLSNGNLTVTKEEIDNQNANNIIYNLRLKENGDLTYDRINILQ